ncbi:MAG: lamin tail domain-containing protein [Clostridiales bacterium]|nr:lamin tail domain-containing protein [Clostridiales bacterium]
MKKPIINTISFLLAALFVFSAAGCEIFSGEVGPANTAQAVVINEVVSANKLCRVDPVLGSVDWVELKNTGKSEADVSGWKLGDSPSFSRAITFPEGTKLAPGGFLAVYCIPDLSPTAPAAEGKLVAPFGISRAGEKLYLASKDNKTSLVDVPYLTTDVSYARRPDGTYGYSGTPTFGAENTNVKDDLESASFVEIPADELLITELVTGSAGWVEIHNITQGDVDLSCYSLSDREDDPAKWVFPEVILPAGGYIAVELNALDPDAPLAASFKVSHAESAIYLFNVHKELADSMKVDPNMPDGVSAVKSEGVVAYTSHITKGAENSEDTFPEIKWTQMEVPGPDAKLVLNEVCPDNKYGTADVYGDRSDWVELLNVTDIPIDLSNYYISDDPNDLTKYRLPKVSLMPHAYVVIFLSGREGTDAEIHAPFKLSSEDGGIFLATLDGMLYDFLPIPEGLLPNASVGRDGSWNVKYYSAPTPGAPNSTFSFGDVSAMAPFDPNSVYISEVLAVSAPRTGGNDWIELVNCSQNRIDLTGWSLTDDFSEPKKFALDGLSISAGGYLVINCDKDSKSSSFAHFSISNGGETLFLLDPNGRIMDLFQTGMTTLGVTSGRADRTQTGERCFFTTATKGRANGTPLSGIVREPVFSKSGLYSSGGETVSITTATAGAEIRYTLDGSTPTRSSHLYTGPIALSGNTVIKARAFMDGLVNSPVATHTYIVGESYSLPVVSISLPRSDYDVMYTAEINERGGVKHGPQVGCFMEYYVDGRLAVSSGAGVRVSGASTSVYPQKSLCLYFRAGYGRSSLDFPLFDGCEVTSFRSIVLRNSGQDAHAGRIRDAFISEICMGMDLDVAYSRPVIVFVNGNYRGIYDMKENLNEDFVAAHYSVPRSSVNIIKRNGKALAGTNTDWYSLRAFCRSYDFSKDSNYEKLASMVDVVSIMDYLIARTYFYDSDMFNQKYWRTTEGTMKWRAVLYDSDYALYGNNPGGSVLSSYFNPAGVAAAHGSITNMDIFCAVNQNKAWRDEFITRYIYYVKYVFNAEHAQSVFDALAAQYRPEMPRHIARWNTPKSMSSWEHEIAALRNCLGNRPKSALRILKSYYGLTDSQFAEYERKADEMRNGN